MFNGWGLSPAGTHAPLEGDMPLKTILAPDGKVAVTVCAGYNNPGLGVLDLETRTTKQYLKLAHSWNGLAFDKEGKRLFVSSGATGEIHVFDYANGELTARSQRFPSRSV